MKDEKGYIRRMMILDIGTNYVRFIDKKATLNF